MSRKHGICGGILLFLLASSTFAQPASRPFNHFSDYAYISNHETTIFNEIIWWWGNQYPGGPMHTNDEQSLFGYPAQLIDTVSTSMEFRRHPEAGPEELVFEHWPVAVFPENLDILRDAAIEQGNFIDNDEGNLQTRLFAHNGQWHWHQWTQGTLFDSSAILESGQIDFSLDQTIFVEGELELYGDSIQAIVSIGAGGNIRLMDNVMIDGVRPYHTYIHPSNPYFIGITSEQEILVADTYANGQGNGRGDGNNNPDRVDIMITAALLALNEFFTFEHQNDSWDDYIWCDPDGEHPDENDERGYIKIRGSLANFRRGYVHRANCGGTGYEKDYIYDYRLRDNPPPNWPRIEWDRAIDEHVVYSDTTINDTWGNVQILPWASLTLGPGTHINLTCDDDTNDEPHFLSRSGGEFYIDGTEENPVIIQIDNSEDSSTLKLLDQDLFGGLQGINADSCWSNLVIHTDPISILHLYLPIRVIGLNVRCSTLRLQNHVFYRQPTSIHSSVFDCSLISFYVIPHDAWSLHSSLILGGIDHSHFGTINKCTFSTGRISIYMRNVEIQNTFFNNTELITHRTGSGTLDYCGWNTDTDTLFSGNIFFGDHNLGNVDPMFVNPDEGDYRLLEDSPLIDAGNPNSPYDPDGTVTDIGAYSYFQESDYAEEPSEPIPSDFRITSVYPNPFNGQTTVRIELPVTSELRIHLYNNLGRFVGELFGGSVNAGYHSFVADLNRLPSGVYYLKVETETRIATERLVLVR